MVTGRQRSRGWCRPQRRRGRSRAAGRSPGSVAGQSSLQRPAHASSACSSSTVDQAEFVLAGRDVLRRLQAPDRIATVLRCATETGAASGALCCNRWDWRRAVAQHRRAADCFHFICEIAALPAFASRRFRSCAAAHSRFDLGECFVAFAHSGPRTVRSVKAIASAALATRLRSWTSTRDDGVANHNSGAPSRSETRPLASRTVCARSETFSASRHRVRVRATPGSSAKSAVAQVIKVNVSLALTAAAPVGVKVTFAVTRRCSD